MSPIKGHFDGVSIVLDEPASLALGQQVQIVVVGLPAKREEPSSPRKSLAGFAKGTFEIEFSPFSGAASALINGDEWDEATALHIDPLDAVPPDFVRRPGSAAGQIVMVDDFNATPEDFEEYL